MIKKTSSNQPCGRDSEYITGAFLKSFSIIYVIKNVIHDFSIEEHVHTYQKIEFLTARSIMENNSIDTRLGIRIPEYWIK